MTSSSEALALASALLVRLPPAAEPVRALEPEDHGWCFVVYWTLANSADAPTPGFGPVVVARADGRVAYLGSQELSAELSRAERELS